MSFFGTELEENVTVTGEGSTNTGANIAGGSGLIGGAIQSISAPFLQKWSQDTARHEAGQAWERSMKSWQMQNEYNTPSAKMARLEEAGLNPNLVYGSGNAISNATGAPSSPQAQTVQRTFDAGPLIQGMHLLNQYQDVKRKIIENDYMRQNVENNTLQNNWQTNVAKQLAKQALSTTDYKKYEASIKGVQEQMAKEGILPGYDMSAGRIVSQMPDGPMRDLLLNTLAMTNQIQKSLGIGFGKLNLGKKTPQMGTKGAMKQWQKAYKQGNRGY